VILNASRDPQARALQAGYNISALGIASKNGHVEAVRVLLTAGADVNAKDEVRGTVMSRPLRRKAKTETRRGRGVIWGV
jgi:ankyrin repeat protein